MNKSDWSGTFWADLGERVASSALGGVLAMITADAAGVADYSVRAWWVLAGIPAATSLVKGLLANLKDSESGPSLLPAPPAPPVNDDGPAE